MQFGLKYGAINLIPFVVCLECKEEVRAGLHVVTNWPALLSNLENDAYTLILLTLVCEGMEWEHHIWWVLPLRPTLSCSNLSLAKPHPHPDPLLIHPCCHHTWISIQSMSASSLPAFALHSTDHQICDLKSASVSHRKDWAPRF